MSVEPTTHHGENISLAPQAEYSSRKPMSVGVDTPIPWLTLRTCAMGTFVSIGGLLFGYDTGQISGFQEMSNYLERYGEIQSNGSYTFSTIRSGLIVSLLSIGTLIGAICGAPLADWMGRRLTIILNCIILTIGLVVQISSPNGKWYQMVIGRWITGLGVGGCSLVVPMYQGESAPRHIHGSIICCYQLFVTLSIFLSYLINLGTETLEGSNAQWRITLGLTFLFALILSGGMLCFPESPCFDYHHSRVNNTHSTLARFYGIPENHNCIIEELNDIQKQLEAELQEQKWHKFLTAPRMFYCIILGMVIQSLQQLNGANYFFYYGTTIMQGAGINNSFITQVILGAVNFGTTFGGLYVVEHFGRRKSLIVGAILMFICFMAFASVGHFAFDHVTPENTPSAGKAMVVLACLFITGFAMTWGPLTWAICVKLFPSKYRAKGMAVSIATNWLWNFLIGFFTPFITDKIDFAYGYVFAGCTFLSIFIAYFCIIEGRGRTLEEIDWMYANHISPWKSEEYEIPQNEFLNNTTQPKEQISHDETA